MKIKNLFFTAVTFFCFFNFLSAQNVHLHVNPQWKECSFQIDPSLTQNAWHRFTKEAGMVTYYRPLTDATPMGVKRVELSILQMNTRIDETADAWNNTFVHPDSTHYLIGGPDLPFPGLSLRTGITRKMDVGVFWTSNPKANYGVIGGQIQYNIIHDTLRNWAMSTRLSFSSLYGPKDLNLSVIGLDLLASKKITVFPKWASVSPYAGVSTYLTQAHEKTDKVNLNDERVTGVQGMIGAIAQIHFVRIGAEYNFAVVNSLSYKIGVHLKF